MEARMMAAASVCGNRPQIEVELACDETALAYFLACRSLEEGRAMYIYDLFSFYRTDMEHDHAWYACIFGKLLE